MALFSTKNLVARQQLEWLVLAVAFGAVGTAGVVSHNVETQRALDTERARLATLVDVVGTDMALNLDAMDRALTGVVRDHPDLTYIDVDLPENMALASFFLLSGSPGKNIALYGEVDLENDDLSQYDAVLLPNFAIQQIKDNSIDLCFNSYSLSEMPMTTVSNYMAHFNRISSKFIYHINHTSVGGIKADEFAVDYDKFELISRAPAMWGQACNPLMDEYEFLYKAKQVSFS